MTKLILSLFILVLPIVARGQTSFVLTGNYALGSNAVGIAMADMNGDQKVDLIGSKLQVNGSDSGVLVFTNDGNGQFGSNSVSTITNIFTFRVADINGDGYLDLITSDAGFPIGHIFVYTNNGSGSFIFNASYNVGNSPLGLCIADVNNDGKLDIICPNAADKTLSVLTNDGSGGFKIASSPATGSDGKPGSVIAVDIEHDGKPELICVNTGYPVAGTTLSVLTNGGNGFFKLASTPTIGRTPSGLVATDCDGDGLEDLICANYLDKNLWVLTNNGSGQFIYMATVTLGFYPFILTAADFNGDGKLDLLCANNTGNTVVTFTNNGSGGFGSNATVVTSRPYDMVAADINEDGKTDFVCVNDGLRPGAFYTTRSTISVYESVPTLAGKLSNGNLILSWPAAWTNWTLLQSFDLTASSWVSFGGTVVDDGMMKRATNLLPQVNSFFRLSHQ